MNKVGGVIVVVCLVAAAYLIMLVTMPVLIDVATTANTTMTAGSNMANYPGTSGALMSAPWVLWFVPGTIGLASVIVILKRR